MEKEFIPYEQALALKELGFDKPCLGYWDDDKVFELNPDFLKGSQMDDTWLTTPTFSQAFRWFREKYNLEGFVNLNDSKEDNFNYYFNYINTNSIHNRREYCDFFIGNFKTYEEAELECLKKLIEIVKEK